MALKHFQSPQKVIQKWKEGLFGHAEFLNLLVQTVTPASLHELAKDVPPDVIEDLKKVVATAPKTSEEWGNMISIRPYCGPWNEEIAAKTREADEQASRRYRLGIEVLRDYFG